MCFTNDDKKQIIPAEPKFDMRRIWYMCSDLCDVPALFNLFRYGAPLKMFWRTHAPYLLKHLNSCTLFTDASPVSPT